MDSFSPQRSDPGTTTHISAHEVDLIRYRDNRTPLYFKLMTGDEFRGAIRWYDELAIRIVQDDRTEVVIYQHAVAFYYQIPK